MSPLACRGFLLGEFKVGMRIVYARGVPSWWEAGYGGYRTKIGNTENGYIPHTILPIIYKLNTSDLKWQVNLWN